MPAISLTPEFPDPADVARTLRLDRRGGGEERARELLAEAEPLLKPRAAYRSAFVEGRSDDTVTVESRIFRSRVLRVNLDGVYKVFPYVITVGPELENASARSGDLLHRYDLETLADLALDAARNGLQGRLARENGFDLLSSMSPGSLEDWPLTEQTPLFGLLGDLPAEIGVRLTDALLMLPRKSISGLFFPSAEAFSACRLCPRDSCPGRKLPGDGAEWERYRLPKP